LQHKGDPRGALFDDQVQVVEPCLRRALQTGEGWVRRWARRPAAPAEASASRPVGDAPAGRASISIPLRVAPDTLVHSAAARSS
jgi:hypothetical protein